MKYIIILSLIFAQSCICHQLYKDDVEKNKIKLNVQSMFITHVAGRYSLYDKNEWFKDKKYDVSVFKIMARAFADFVTEDNEFKDHKNKKVITFNVEPTQQCYTQANYNALFFYNFIKNSFLFECNGDCVNLSSSDDYACRKTMSELIDHYCNVLDIETHLKTAQQQIKQYLEVFWIHHSTNDFNLELLNILRLEKTILTGNDFKYKRIYDQECYSPEYRMNGSREINCSIELKYDSKCLKSVKLGKMEEILINKQVNEIDNLYDLLNKYNIKHNIMIYNNCTLLKSYANKYDKKKQSITIPDEPYEIVFKGAADTDNPFLEFIGDYQCDILTIKPKYKEIKGIQNSTQKIRLIIPETTYGHKTRLGRTYAPQKTKNTADKYLDYYNYNKGPFGHLTNSNDRCIKTNLKYLQYEIEIIFEGEIYAPTQLYHFFGGNAITRIDMKDVKWSAEYANTREMFFQCSNLTEIVFPDDGKLKCFDMDSMFAGCEKLLKLDVGSFDTTKVRSMKCMFADCHSLQLIRNLENFDTQSVTSMESMFKNCYSLQYLNIHNFSFTDLQVIDDMFKGCRSLTTIEANNQRFKVYPNHYNEYIRRSIYGDCISLNTYPSILAIDNRNGNDVTKEVFHNAEKDNTPNLIFSRKK